MEVAGAVVGAAVGSVLTCALNQLGVISLSDQIQTLRDKKGELIARVNEVNEILQIAEVQQGKTHISETQNWLSDANNVINKADDVDKEANVGRRCLSGVLPNCCSPNCRSRLKLREQISEFIKEMVDLLDKASRFSEESLTFLGMEMPTTGLIGSTADENLKMVWECIVGDKFEKIGVYGMGGVGKTTIMKTISNQLVQERIRFENILWVTVSKAVDAQTLQKQIAKVLGLDLSDEQDEDEDILWVMEGLVEGSSKEDEILRGHVILNTLKRCCMLEEVSLKGRYVEDSYFADGRDRPKMHDLIRDMTLYITKTKPKFMVRTGLSSTEIPHKDDWSEDLERVSFMYSRIEDILIIPKCPKLRTFMLSDSYYDGRQLKHIGHGFFMHMKSLTVLDLSGTNIESLPNSVFDLVNLRGLLLSYCEKLVRVPSLSKLQSLRVLKLTSSAIEV